MHSQHYLLISDQDSLARSLLPGVLPHGVRLSMVTTPFDGALLMREGKLDAVLVALEANDEDGAVLCRTIRHYSNAPIVMLVNSGSRDQVARGYRLGADAHIEIPCDPRVFRARVSALLRRRALSPS